MVMAAAVVAVVAVVAVDETADETADVEQVLVFQFLANPFQVDETKLTFELPYSSLT